MKDIPCKNCITLSICKIKALALREKEQKYTMQFNVPENDNSYNDKIEEVISFWTVEGMKSVCPLLKQFYMEEVDFSRQIIFSYLINGEE